jgi:hypothetical protein
MSRRESHYCGYRVVITVGVRGTSLEISPTSPDLPILHRYMTPMAPGTNELTALKEAHRRIDGVLGLSSYPKKM